MLIISAICAYTCWYLLSYVRSSFDKMRSNSTSSTRSARPAHVAASLVRAAVSKQILSATSILASSTFALNCERQAAHYVYLPLNVSIFISEGRSGLALVCSVCDFERSCSNLDFAAVYMSWVLRSTYFTHSAGNFINMCKIHQEATLRF